MANFKGGHDSDVYIGTDATDTISGGGGDDTLKGAGGNDSINGGPGRDFLDGGDGNDTINGGAGSDDNDVILGGAGDDIIIGGAGDDIIDGGSGIDTASYADATTWVTVSLAIGSPQQTRDGLDMLTSIENLTGSDYSDTLTGNAGANVLSGGAGDDTLFVDQNDTVDGGSNGYYVGAGDRLNLDLSTAAAGVTVDLTQAFAGGVSMLNGHSITGVEIYNHIIGSAYGDEITIGNAVPYPWDTSGLSGGGGDDILIGGSAKNALSGDDGNDTLKGMAGNDSLSGGAGADMIDGGDGDDSIDGGDGEDIITGGAGNDAIIGSGGADMLDGGDGDDYVSGDAGDDLIDGGAGNDIVFGFDTAPMLDGTDSLNGGSGDDHLYADKNDSVDGGDGIDTLYLDLSAATVGMVVDLTQAFAGGVSTYDGHSVANIEQYDKIIGTGFADMINVGDGGQNDASPTVFTSLDPGVFGGNGDDTLIGGSGNNIFNGGAGNDILDGRTGSDTADYSDATGAVRVSLAITIAQDTGGAGIDTLISIENLTGSNKSDMLSGDGVANLIDGGGGNDVIAGGAGDDTLLGGKSNDVLMGDTGDDLLTGDAGNDTLTGGIGNDLLMGGLGDDVIDGGVGTDTASYADSTHSVAVSLAITTAQNTLGAGTDTLTSIENLIGSAYGDKLTGDAGDNVLSGGYGIDIIYGGDGNDTISGGGDGYSFAGGANVLNGGTGIDTVSYGDVATWVYVSLANTGIQATHAGYDMLSGFENLTGSVFDDILAGDANANAIDGGAGDDTLSAADGADVLIGGSGADVLDGGADNDRLYADGRDTIDGGAGIDTLNLDLSAGTAGVGLDLTAAFSGGVSMLNGHAVTGIEQYLQIVGTAFNDTINVGDASQGFDGAITYDGNPGVQGGDGDDVLIGGAAGNYLFGQSGNDVLSGGGGSDYLDGGAGINILDGGDGSDYAYLDFGGTTGDIVLINGGVAGSVYTETIDGVAASTITNIEAQEMIGGSGDDRLGVRFAGVGGSGFIGGAGDDTVVIDFSASAVVANSTAGGASIVDNIGDASGTVSYDGFEHLDYSAGSGGGSIVGTIGSDVLRGGDGVDILDGGDGDDTIIGGAGNDVLTGGAGIDTVSYAGATNGVRVLLMVTTPQSTAAGGKDTLSGFENLTGSSFGDQLTGDAGDNVIKGGLGNDNIYAGDGNDLVLGGMGSDHMEGGAGIDTVSYADATGGVKVDLSITGLQGTRGAGNDTLSGFENVIGSDYDDKLTGDAGDNMIAGGNGDDILKGGLGADILDGGAGTDIASYADATGGVDVSLVTMAGAGDQLISIEGIEGGSFADHLAGSAGDDILYGRDGDDTIDAGNGDDLVLGGSGDDHLDGGAGIDTISYEDAVAAVMVNLSSVVAQNTGGGGTDTLSGFENLTGSAFADTLTGNDLANILSGGAGNDKLFGGLGDDTLFGGADSDQLTGGAGADTLTGGIRGDRFILTTASDSAVGQDDVITDFNHAEKDRIDVSQVYGGKFSFLGSADFTGHAGELHYGVSGSDLLVSGDVDGDGHADFEIKLLGIASLDTTDFIL